MAKKLFGKTNEEIEQLQKNITTLSRELKKATRTINDQQEHITELTRQISILHKTQKNISLTLEDNISTIHKVTTELAIFKPTMEKTILEQITNTLEAELAHATNNIYAQANGFSQAKEVFKEHLKQTKEVGTEIKKLKEISSQINEKDFQLEKYAKELAKNDKTKLELMKRVDELEKMLAKIKRSK